MIVSVLRGPSCTPQVCWTALVLTGRVNLLAPMKLQW